MTVNLINLISARRRAESSFLPFVIVLWSWSKSWFKTTHGKEAWQSSLSLLTLPSLQAWVIESSVMAYSAPFSQPSSSSMYSSMYLKGSGMGSMGRWVTGQHVQYLENITSTRWTVYNSMYLNGQVRYWTGCTVWTALVPVPRCTLQCIVAYLPQGVQNWQVRHWTACTVPGEQHSVQCQVLGVNTMNNTTSMYLEGTIMGR